MPGQEEGNIDFVVNNNVGALALEPFVLIDTLRILINPGSPVLQIRTENAKRLSRPRASFDIANCILSYLPPVERQSIWQSAQWRKRKRLLAGRLRSAIRLRRPRRLPRPRALLRGPIARRINTLRIRNFSDEDTHV